jgi:hypothetical protein
MQERLERVATCCYEEDLCMYTYVYITKQHDARASRARGDVLQGRGPMCTKTHAFTQVYG